MNLKEKCGVCSSWKWCGRRCKNSPPLIDDDSPNVPASLLTEEMQSKRKYRTFRCHWCGKKALGMAHAQYCSAYCRVRSHRAKEGEGGREGMSGNLRFRVMERDGFKCLYCGQNSNDGAILEVDHFRPVTRGGTNEFTNLVTACKECNRGKRDGWITSVTIEELRAKTRR